MRWCTSSLAHCFCWIQSRAARNILTCEGTAIKISTERFEGPGGFPTGAWSPDSKWLVYDKYLDNHLHGVFAYSLEGKKETQITDGTADSRYPVFDKDGKTLYFAASTDVGLSAGWLDLSSFQHPLTRNVYAVVLKKGDGNPVEPQSDEEKVGKDEKGKEGDKDKDKEEDKDKDKGKDSDKEKGKEGEKKEKVPAVTIDFEGITQRVVALPIPEANYVQLDAGKSGVLFLSEIVDVPRFGEPTLLTVAKFELKTRKT